MVQRSRGATSRTRRPRAKYSWVQWNDGPTTLVAGAQAVLNILALWTTLEGLRGLSLVRLIPKIRIRATTAVNVEWAYGMTTVTGDAFVGGSIPDPLGDPHRWHYFRGGVTNNTTYASGAEDDLKISGRLDQDRRLITVMENASTSGGSLEYQISGRLLIRLP